MLNADSLVGLLGRLIISSGETKEILVPLTGVSVEAEVVDFIGEVKLSQCFRNSENVPIEAVFHFPVDQASSVCAFHAEYEDGSIVNGIAKEKGKAKEEYNHSRRSGKQSNLLEATRKDIFTLNIGNLPPGEYVKISITYVTSLKSQNDAVAFVLPTFIAPRYSPPNHPLTSSLEAQAMEPPSVRLKLFGLDVNVKFRCRTNIKTITCPTHPEEPGINFQTHGKVGTAVLKDIAMDRDLVLLLTEEKPHQPRACIEVGENGSLAGFVTLFPKLEFKDIDREIIFVIDRSGSMSWNNMSAGKSQIEQARNALMFFLRALPTSCTFNVVGFGSRFETLFDVSKRYDDENLDKATRYTMQMGANMGGTEIRTPLEHIFEQKVSSHITRQIFVLTDGQVSNDLEVFDVIRRNCSTGKCRVFGLGIGSGVSRHLVEGMARAGRGTAHFVEGGDTSCLRVKVMSQLKQALQPALEEVSVDWALPVKRNENSTFPTKPPLVKTLLGYRSPSIDERPEPPAPRVFPTFNPPIFNNERFLSFVLFPAGVTDIPESVTVKCNSPDGPLEVRIDISDDEVFHGSIAHKMAARAAITEHEDCRNGGLHRMDARGLISESEALQLALDNNLVSDKTSFIAVKEESCIEPGTETASRVIPQYIPFDPVMLPASGQRFARRGSPHRRGYASSLPLGSATACAHTHAESPTMRSLTLAGLTSSVSQARPARFTRDGETITRSMKMPERRSSYGLGASTQKQCIDGYSSERRSSGSDFLLVGRNENGEAQRLLRKSGWKVGIQTEGSPSRLDDRNASKHVELSSNRRKKHQQKQYKMMGKARGEDRAIQQEKDRGPMRNPSTQPYSDEGSRIATVFDGDNEITEITAERKEKESSLAHSSQTKSSLDQLLQLCLLQKANGSFIFDDFLARAVGISMQEINHMVASTRVGKQGPRLFPTLLAVTVMRGRFSRHREEWELHEAKAIDWLVSQGLRESEINDFVKNLELQLKL